MRLVVARFTLSSLARLLAPSLVLSLSLLLPDTSSSLSLRKRVKITYLDAWVAGEVGQRGLSACAESEGTSRKKQSSLTVRAK